MKIGIVDIDTSHPQNWIPIERELGHEVVGLWDGGAIHPKQYVAEFAEKFEISRIYGSLEEMAGDVDCAIIHSCDWDTHIAKARVFVEAGKAVLLDKPLAGNYRDLQTIHRWADSGVRITGGSSLRFAPETRDFLARPVAQRGEIHTVLTGCGVDDFNYGIHAYSLACGALGGGIESVEFLGENVQKRYQLKWKDGRVAVLVVGQAGQWLPFYATLVTDIKVETFVVDNSRIYRALLEAVLPYLSGQTDVPPVVMNELMEAELAAMAAKISRNNGGGCVSLGDVTEKFEGFDGAEFARDYRLSRYPEKK